MREFLMYAAVLAPVVILGLMRRAGDDPPTWLTVIGLGWFVVGSLVLGWYDGWVKRALVGILSFIPLMAAFVWWSGAVPSGWPTAITILLIAVPVGVLVAIGLATGWFAGVLEGLKQTAARDSGARQK